MLFALERLASNPWFKPFKLFKQFKSLTLPVQSHDPSGALKRNLSQRRSPFAQDLRSLCGDENRLTAQQIAGLRQILIGMDHEKHVDFQCNRIIDAYIPG
jgi:hypothetical protein